MLGIGPAFKHKSFLAVLILAKVPSVPEHFPSGVVFGQPKLQHDEDDDQLGCVLFFEQHPDFFIEEDKKQGDNLGDKMHGESGLINLHWYLLNVIVHWKLRSKGYWGRQSRRVFWMLTSFPCASFSFRGRLTSWLDLMLGKEKCFLFNVCLGWL